MQFSNFKQKYYKKLSHDHKLQDFFEKFTLMPGLQ